MPFFVCTRICCCCYCYSCTHISRRAIFIFNLSAKKKRYFQNPLLPCSSAEFILLRLHGALLLFNSFVVLDPKFSRVFYFPFYRRYIYSYQSGFISRSITIIIIHDSFSLFEAFFSFEYCICSMFVNSFSYCCCCCFRRR